jgi:hypothetical protein
MAFYGVRQLAAAVFCEPCGDIRNQDSGSKLPQSITSVLYASAQTKLSADGALPRTEMNCGMCTVSQHSKVLGPHAFDTRLDHAESGACRRGTINVNQLIAL